ncbi:hypothetical protein D3C75_693490 [compost metagenome]
MTTGISMNLPRVVMIIHINHYRIVLARIFACDIAANNDRVFGFRITDPIFARNGVDSQAIIGVVINMHSVVSGNRHHVSDIVMGSH